MRVAPVIEQLKGVGYLSVGGARDYRGLRTVPAKLPAAFVVPLSRQTETLSRTGIIHQNDTHNFAVVSLITEARAGLAVDTDALGTLEYALIDRLSGWMYPDAASPVIATGGLDMADQLGCFAWATTFSFTTIYRKAL